MLYLAISQAEYGHAILQDIGMICIIAVVLAGVLHAFLRKTVPGLGWNRLGKVSTEGLVPLDILACALVTAPYCLGILLPYKEPSGESGALTIALNFGILAMLAGLVLFIYNSRGMLTEALGLKPKHPFQVIAWAIAAYILIFLMLIILTQMGLEDWLSARLGEKQVQEVVEEMIHAEDIQKKLTLIIGACVVAPVIEEIIFRGYLYPVVKRYTEPVVAVLFTGVLFAAIHGNIWAMIPLTVVGIVLAILYEKSGSIWACILCHAMFNGINTVLMLTDKV